MDASGSFLLGVGSQPWGGRSGIMVTDRGKLFFLSHLHEVKPVRFSVLLSDEKLEGKPVFEAILFIPLGHVYYKA